MISSTDVSDQEWLQFVEEVQLSSSPATSSGGGIDGGADKLSQLSQLNQAASTDHDHDHNQLRLSPKGCISKPVRRRSRAPRRTPATLLTANATNFRSLVQKFTGRPTAPFSPMSHRGPLTLNFELGSQQYNIHPFGSSDYHNHHPRREVDKQQQCFPADDTSIIDGGPKSQGGFTMENISLDADQLINIDDIGYFW